MRCPVSQAGELSQFCRKPFDILTIEFADLVLLSVLTYQPQDRIRRVSRHVHPRLQNQFRQQQCARDTDCRNTHSVTSDSLTHIQSAFGTVRDNDEQHQCHEQRQQFDSCWIQINYRSGKRREHCVAQVPHPGIHAIARPGNGSRQVNSRHSMADPGCVDFVY